MKKRGTLIIDLMGHELTPQEIRMLQHPLINGVILFSRNFLSGMQLKKLCYDIKTIKPGMVIFADQEGGRVQRFKDGFARLKAQGAIGKMYEQDQNKALETAYWQGLTMASQLIAHGIDVSFAPVLDLKVFDNSIIGDRAFHEDPMIVTALARALIKGMHSAGMSATAKHFPGHGGIEADSHVEAPMDARSYEEIERHDLKPYKALIQEGLIGAIMSAHITYPKIDPQPATYSSVWMQEVLRRAMNFTGVTISDDLNMQGAHQTTYVARFEAAIAAGCDMAMLCNNHAAVCEILDTVSAKNYLIPEAKWAIMRRAQEVVRS